MSTFNKKDILIVDKSEPVTPNKLRALVPLFGIIFIISVFFMYGFLFLTLKIRTVNHLHRDVAALKKDIEMLKMKFMDDDLLQEIADFDKEYDHSTSSEVYGDYSDYNSLEIDSPEIMKEEINVNRSKREVVAATIDGVAIIAESYAEEKSRNRSAKHNDKSMGESGSYKNVNSQKLLHRTYHPGWTTRTYVKRGDSKLEFPEATPTTYMSRNSRVMQTDDEKTTKPIKKIIRLNMLKSNGMAQTKQTFQEHIDSSFVTVTPTVKRTRHGKHGHRRSNFETMDERQQSIVPAAHFFGNTSHYKMGRHHHYRGNGHFAHPDGSYVDWAPINWMKLLDMERVFQLKDGEVTIKETGLYFIYAQIYYVDEHEVNGYKMLKNNEELARCVTMTVDSKKEKRNTCFTSTIDYLNDGDKIAIKDIESMRYVYLAHAKSFFGLFKISDVKLK